MPAPLPPRRKRGQPEREGAEAPPWRWPRRRGQAGARRRPVGRNLGEQQIDGDAAERQVDGEDRPPDAAAEGRQDEPAEHRPERRRQGGRRRPDADRPAPFALRIGFRDDRQAAGYHDGGADALHSARRDEHGGVRAPSAQADRGERRTARCLRRRSGAARSGRRPRRRPGSAPTASAHRRWRSTAPRQASRRDRRGSTGWRWRRPSRR